MEFVCPTPDTPISQQAYLAAAEDLGCDLAAIMAVAEVESRRDPFQADGRPTILFERHKFRKYSRGRFNGTHAHLSGPAGKYGTFAEQWDKLEEAMTLDREAALFSASYGQFQIMGFNHAVCGYDDVEAFVAAMAQSADRHLDAFVGFVLGHNLDGALRRHDWTRFARGYNGAGFRRNGYHTKMAEAYARLAADPAVARKTPSDPDADSFRVSSVRDLQTALAYLGIDAGPADNIMGPMTRAAIRTFQRFVHAEETGAISNDLKAAVQAAYHMMRRFDALGTA